MIKIIKRNPIASKQKFRIRLMAMFLALTVFAIILLFLGKQPLNVYFQMIIGSLGTKFRIIETLKIAIPNAIVSLGIMIAFKLKFWNIGGQGQIIAGAIASSYFALFIPDIPRPLLLFVMILSSFIVGGIWAAIPAYFKTKYNTNETLFTLMMNYIALNLVTYLQYALWKDPSAGGFAKIAMFSPSARLPEVFGLNIGWILMILCVIAIYLLINHMKLGYEIAVVGESIETARYAGIDVKSTTIKTLFISGGICGLVGVIQAAGVNGTLSVDVASSFGSVGIIIAWISGANTLAIPIISFLFAIVTQGASFAQSAFQIPAAVSEILQGIILIFVLAAEFFIVYEVKFMNDKALRGGK